MSYRVNPDGSIDCASAEEALNLQSLIHGRTSMQPNGNGAHPRPQKAKKLKGQGRDFLRVLLRQPLTSEDVAEKMSTKVSSFPPMYRGLKAWAEETGFDYKQLLVRTQTPQGVVLGINESLRSIVEEAVK